MDRVFWIDSNSINIAIVVSGITCENGQDNNIIVEMAKSFKHNS